MVLTAIGMVGVVLVIAAYALLSTGRLRADEARYQVINVTGTVGILLSLITQWNLASFIANAAWLLIGLVGGWVGRKTAEVVEA